MSVKRQHNIAGARKGPNLRNLKFSPDANPLLEPESITVKRRYVRAGRGRDLVDPETGERSAVATIHTVEDKDDAEFVKLFAAGVKASYSLSRTATKVFQAVLGEYQSMRMNGGYADSVYLAWFDHGLSGKDVGMSEKTFQTGLKELLSKRFIAPRSPNMYWVNPSLFFKGDRVAFIKEYHRKSTVSERQLDLGN